MAAWWLIRRVNILSEAAVFIFKMLGLSDSNMPGGIILLATSVLCRISPLKSFLREKSGCLEHQVLLRFCVFSVGALRFGECWI